MSEQRSSVQMTEGVNPFASAGEVSFMTYIREIPFGDQRAWAVCSDEGVPLAVFHSSEAAYYAARQFDLTPQSVH